MITLTLLHPVQSTPVQSWTFSHEAAIRFGRAEDNHVVLYSAVVSRHHVELRRSGSLWEVVNLGTNGTYLDGKRIHQAPLTDGGIIRLARSGPNLHVRINFNDLASPPLGLSATDTITEGSGRETEDSPQSGKEDQEEEDEEEDRLFYVRAPSPLPWQLKSNPLETKLPPCFEAGHSNHPHHGSELFCADCGQPLQVWKKLGNYQILKPLEGSSHSYLGWREGFTLVLKTLPPEGLDHPQLKSLFQQQICALCQLNHPGLPRVLEGFSIAGQPFLVMEAIYGPTLKQEVALRGALPQPEAISTLLPVCDTLAYLHQHDPPIIHQDIKPSNLIRPTFTQRHSPVVLVGLGNVTLLTSEAGTMLSNEGYEAPEQQAGQPIPASDIYSLGASLVYLLTGEEPHRFYHWGAEDYRLDVEEIPGLSPQMRALIHTLTAPQPQDRYASALEVGEHLRQLN